MFSACYITFNFSRLVTSYTDTTVSSIVKIPLPAVFLLFLITVDAMITTKGAPATVPTESLIKPGPVGKCPRKQLSVIRLQCPKSLFRNIQKRYGLCTWLPGVHAVVVNNALTPLCLILCDLKP